MPLLRSKLRSVTVGEDHVITSFASNLLEPQVTSRKAARSYYYSSYYSFSFLLGFCHERLQSAAHHTREALISSHGVAARKVEQTPPIGNRERI